MPLLTTLDLSRVPAGSVTRFAPSPTGRLHLGHVANAAWTWGVADRVGAKVLLRIEDHDRGRCRREYEAAILRDLDWLGLIPDSFSRSSLDRTPSPFRQSDNDQRYCQALERLANEGPVYHCQCSRRLIAESLGNDVENDELRYPGICRGLGLAPGAGRGIRVGLADREVHFDDLRLGPHRQRPAKQCGDLSVRDGVGNWTYQLTVTVDDLAHGVTLVIRGEDLLQSTGRQLLLAEMLGRREPILFLHHPLIRDESGAKLSKRNRSESLESLRQAGWSPERVLGQALYLTGALDRPEPVKATELGRLFAG